MYRTQIDIMAERPSLSHVLDKGSLRRFRTEIPNTVVKGLRGRGLSLPARWLYVYLKSVAGDEHECWQNTTTLARGAQLGRGTVASAKAELIAEKLIAVVPGHRGNHETDRIYILDIWDENMREFASIPRSSDEHDQDGGTQDTASANGDRVQEVNPAVHVVNPRVQEVNPAVHVVNPTLYRNKKIPREEDPREEKKEDSLPTVESVPQPFTPLDLLALYNTEAPAHCPRARALTPDREKKARACLKLFPDEAFWREVFTQAQQSPLLRGETVSSTHPNWRADFMWFVGKGKDGTENCLKVVEGKYADTIRPTSVLDNPRTAANVAAAQRAVERYYQKHGYPEPEETPHDAQRPAGFLGAPGRTGGVLPHE